jgi:hypothetical protein
VSVDVVSGMEHPEPVPDHRFSATEAPAAIEGVEVAMFDGEVVLFDPGSAMLHRLGAIAGAVWLCCDGSTDVATMVDELAETFGMDRAETTQIVHDALETFADEGLLHGRDPVTRTALEPEPTLAADGTEILIAPADP